MDSLLELELSDGRRPAGKAAKLFEVELRRRLSGWYGKKHKPEQAFEVAPLVSKYRLLICLQILTNRGESAYLSDYLRVSDSLRADLRALNLSSMITPASVAGDETASKGYDLGMLTVSELRLLRYLTGKMQGDAVSDNALYDDLLAMASSLRPPAGLLEYHPSEEPVVEEVREPEDKAPRIRDVKPPTPSPQVQQVLTEAELRDARIQDYHYELMKKDDKNWWP